MNKKMNKKMMECFTPHAFMHTLIGLGLGFVLTALFPSLASIVLGVVVVVVATVWDMMR